MIEAGLWYRPSYFPKAGETTWREACDREVRMVRDAVGVADVSTITTLHRLLKSRPALVAKAGV